LLAPKGTPKEIVDRLSTALHKILKEPDVIDKFDRLGAEARATTPREFTTYLAAEDARWTPVIKRAHIHVN